MNRVWFAQVEFEEALTRSETVEEAATATSGRPELLWLFPHDPPLLTPLDARTLTIGRSSQCDVTLPTQEASRVHARVEPDASLWVIHDAKSRNGVYLDGRRVDSAVLRVGTLVRCGGAVALVVRAGSFPDGSAFRQIAEGLFGGARLAQRLKHARSAAASELSVVVEGPTGSGKERVARAIHGWSGRSGPFVAVNCAAVPEGLAEAQLFGHRRGAFTGAEQAHTGYFRAADGGTLFLDEVIELPASVQAKLLRAVELKEVVPLGDCAPAKVDVRIVVASQGSLLEAVRSGHMRPDLYARLCGISVSIPALRERVEDIPYLFRLFARRAAGGRRVDLDAKMVERLCLHRWPFNVRELEALATRLVVMFAEEQSFGISHLENEGVRFGESPEVPAADEDGASEGWRRLVEALRDSAGNVIRASQAAGISRQRAYRLMASHPEFDVAHLRVQNGARQKS